jgi:DNA-binding response OmpR family regulator
MKILGIDDNRDLLDLCEVALSAEGHEYTGIDNGKEGLDAIKDKKFDLVLLDLSMPDFSGEDVIDALVKEGIMNKQKIIVFTASTPTEKEVGPLLEKGLHSMMSKPLDIDALIETIRKMASDV